VTYTDIDDGQSQTRDAAIPQNWLLFAHSSTEVSLEEIDVGQTAERVVYPFTFVFKQEDGQWAALACEVDVASCGSTLEEARDGLKEAVGLYLAYMIEHGLRDQVARPVSREGLTEFCQGEHTVEYHAAIVDIISRPVVRLSSTQFVRSELAPADCRYALA
jgi:predicted RNase H-like HicB family nuclease